MQKLHFPSLPVKGISHSRSGALCVALLAGALWLLSVSPQVLYRRAAPDFRASAAPAPSPAPKQQGCCANLPATPRRMISTYYTTEDGFRSTLVLNNKGPNQIMVTPILHSQSGQTFTASLVVVGGHSSSEVDLNAIAASAGPQFRSGSLEFTYEGRMLEIGGGLRIVDAEKSLIFDEQMLEPGMKFPSSQLEAVYAVPFEDSRVSVIVTNTTAQPILVDGDAIFAGANGHHPVQGRLGPHETKIVNLPHGLVKKASAGAVSLSHNGGKGALLAKIHLQDADRGYSESIDFINPGGKTTERHGAGLRLGRINNDPLTPVIALRNLGDSATTVTATIPYSKQDGEAGTIALPQLILAPGEIKLLNTSNPQLKQNDFATAGLEIKYTGAPGSVVASASSVSQSGNQVFAVPMKDPQGGLSSTGGYPWFIKETSSTVVFIKNVTEEPQDFILSIIYSGGRWRLNPSPLAPGQTIAVDVRKLRDTQERGVGDDVIPLDATLGHISWGARGGKDKVLIGRAQTVDFSKGLAATYECQCLCVPGYDYSRIWPAPAVMSPEGTQDLTVLSGYHDCFGRYDEFPETNLFAFEYSSNDPGVATFTYPNRVTAIAPGTVGLSATFPEYTIDNPCPYQDPSEQCACTNSPTTGYVSTLVTVWAPDFTVAHNKSDTGIKPTGIVAGINGADPPITAAETQATVTVSTDPPTSGLKVTLSVVADEESEFAAGGHVNHTGVRPVGTLSRSSGTTDQNGTFTAVYTAPIFGGAHKIRATMSGVTKEVGIGVSIPGLSLLGEGDDYELTGAPPGSRHPTNHFGTATAVDRLPLIASDYLAMYPGSSKMGFNDMSLSRGGKFEIAGNWGNGSHREHRVGRNCDVRYINIPENRHASVEAIFLNRGVINWLKHPTSPADTAPPHYHVRL